MSEKIGEQRVHTQRSYMTSKIFFFSMIFCLILLFAAGTANASSIYDFTFVNVTEYDVVNLWISPHDRDTWEQNILRSPIVSGGHRRILFGDYSRVVPLWDIKIELSNGIQLKLSNDPIDLRKWHNVEVYVDSNGVFKIKSKLRKE